VVKCENGQILVYIYIYFLDVFMKEFCVSPQCHSFFDKKTCFYEHGFWSGGKFMSSLDGARPLPMCVCKLEK